MEKIIEIDGKYYQECRVVLLPADGKPGSVINLDNRELVHISQYSPKLENGNQHLYIISDEEIKEGDIDSNVFIFKSDNELITCLAGKGFGRVKGIGSYFKIIATTDNKISINLGKEKWVAPTNSNYDQIYTRLCPYPQIPQQFIEEYIAGYNRGTVIEKVLVKYEVAPIYCNNGSWFPIKYQLKISKDNTVSIERMKDSYSREEVVALFNKCGKDLELKYRTIQYPSYVLNRWIEQNL